MQLTKISIFCNGSGKLRRFPRAAVGVEGESRCFYPGLCVLGRGLRGGKGVKCWGGPGSVHFESKELGAQGRAI